MTISSRSLEHLVDVDRLRARDGVSEASPGCIEHLFSRYAREGDTAAREALIEHFMPLARRLAGRFRLGRETVDDLEQVACLGLIKAIDRYEPELGPFTRFAVPNVLGELRRHMRDKSWALHVPRSVQERLLKVNSVISDLSAELGRSPRVGEIAKRSSLAVEDVIEALEAGQSYRPVELDAAASAGGGEEGPTLKELLGRSDPHYDYVDLGGAIGPAFRALPEREQQVVRLRLIDDLDQQQIADRIGVSQMHISRLLRRSLGQLAEATKTPA